MSTLLSKSHCAYNTQSNLLLIRFTGEVWHDFLHFFFGQQMTRDLKLCPGDKTRVCSKFLRRQEPLCWVTSILYAKKGVSMTSFFLWISKSKGISIFLWELNIYPSSLLLLNACKLLFGEVKLSYVREHEEGKKKHNFMKHFSSESLKI